MSAATAVILTHVPLKLHRDVKKLAKEQHTSIAQFSRDAIALRVKQVVAEEREGSTAPAPKRKTSAVTDLKPFDQRPGVEIPKVVPIDRLAAIFDKHATRIMQVATDPQQVALRQEEAFQAIRKMSPLKYRDGDKIAERLDALIAEKVSVEAEDEANETEQRIPSLFNRVPAAAPSVDNMPLLINALKSVFAAKEPVEDLLAGKAFNRSKVRSSAVIDE